MACVLNHAFARRRQLRCIAIARGIKRNGSTWKECCGPLGNRANIIAALKKYDEGLKSPAQDAAHDATDERAAPTVKALRIAKHGLAYAEAREASGQVSDREVAALKAAALEQCAVEYHRLRELAESSNQAEAPPSSLSAHVVEPAACSEGVDDALAAVSERRHSHPERLLQHDTPTGTPMPMAFRAWTSIDFTVRGLGFGGALEAKPPSSTLPSRSSRSSPGSSAIARGTGNGDWTWRWFELMTPRDETRRIADLRSITGRVEAVAEVEAEAVQVDPLMEGQRWLEEGQAQERVMEVKMEADVTTEAEVQAGVEVEAVEAVEVVEVVKAVEAMEARLAQVKEAKAVKEVKVETEVKMEMEAVVEVKTEVAEAAGAEAGTAEVLDSIEAQPVTAEATMDVEAFEPKAGATPTVNIGGGANVTPSTAIATSLAFAAVQAALDEVGEQVTEAPDEGSIEAEARKDAQATVQVVASQSAVVCEAAAVATAAPAAPTARGGQKLSRSKPFWELRLESKLQAKQGEVAASVGAAEAGGEHMAAGQENAAPVRRAVPKRVGKEGAAKATGAESKKENLGPANRPVKSASKRSKNGRSPGLAARGLGGKSAAKVLEERRERKEAENAAKAMPPAVSEAEAAGANAPPPASPREVGAQWLERQEVAAVSYDEFGTPPDNPAPGAHVAHDVASSGHVASSGGSGSLASDSPIRVGLLSLADGLLYVPPLNLAALPRLPHPSPLTLITCTAMLRSHVSCEPLP